ncbi:NAD(P)-binding domain protein [Akanthomyces lecanii RCEF 1005]|uniref:NAD(P)-binding domain protein n=1 Tax=Akanthomyces lecanii RCEF 1005 TaxID=1081108 RepID=A0A168F332_CORDF|nr:NAD(P)-binding domain protein [Akanthomyces lecanii RCEF 1005]
MGRSQTSFDRIAAECKEINQKGRYIFVQGDISLLRNVDGLCKKVQDQEKAINIVFWSAGTLISGQTRGRRGIRRVVSVSTGTSEGEIDFDDFQLLNGGGIGEQRAHNNSIISLTNIYFAESAPTISFVHDYPGHVKSGISRGTTGVLKAAFLAINALGPLLFFKPEQESGA